MNAGRDTLDLISERLTAIENRLAVLEQNLAGVHALLLDKRTEKSGTELTR